MKPGERFAVEDASLDLRLPAHPEALRTVRQVAVDFARGIGADEECVQAVAVAVNEAATNAVVHGYRGGRDGPIRLAASSSRGRMVITLSDDGLGASAPARNGDETGRGLPLMRALSESVEMRRGTRGTRVQLSFALHGGS
jgi:anti-sigma regulatory factor (Ser/Thr protein kinase)